MEWGTVAAAWRGCRGSVGVGAVSRGSPAWEALGLSEAPHGPTCRR